MTAPLTLKSIIFTGADSGPHLLITGGVHGDEYEPMLALRQLARRPELSQVRGRLTLVPVVNEGAFARGQRTAADGLDLARTCPGRADGTLTERVALALSNLIRSADYYVDLHTGGAALQVWPLAGYVLHPRADVLETQRAMARAFGLPVIWGTDPTLPGRSLSVARDAGVPAIYTEFLGGGGCSPEGVRAYVEGCLGVMRLLGLLPPQSPHFAKGFTPGFTLPAPDGDADHLPSVGAPPRVVEDHRPQSGHMQRCYPAPADGCFEAEVSLGQRVAVGQPLGAVVDPLGQDRQTVAAEEAGYVLVLRTCCSVRRGDSLAVILPAADSPASAAAAAR